MKRLIISLAVLLSGCSGEMQGMIRGTGERIQFKYEQGLETDSYTAVIGSEKFKGKAVMDGSSSLFGTLSDSQIFGSVSTNRFVAVLFGSQGSSLNCQMRYADSSGLTSLGGVGACNHSDGRVIDVIW